METVTTSQQSNESPELTFAEIALPAGRLGIPQFRLRPRHKEPLEKGWPELATTDEATILRWSAETPDANAGSMAGDKYCFVETDEPGIYKQFMEETGESFQT